MFHKAFCAAILALMLLVSQVAAQDAPQIDYEKWESFASQAESALGNADTPEEELASIRQNAIRWREQFQQAQGANAPRIETVKEQIKSLGPAPADGETEAEDIAGRRTTLNTQLSELQAPGLNATEALSRADSIVSQVDNIARQREAEEIMTVTRSPLLPSSWLAAGKDVVAIVQGMMTEARQGWKDVSNLKHIGELLTYLAAAAALLYGRHLVDRLPSMLGARASGDARAVITFVVSLAQIMVPVVALFLLAYALNSTGLFGEWTQPLLLGLPLAGLVFFVGRWLIRALFAAQPVAYDTLLMPQSSRTMARLYGTGLSVMTALHVWLANSMLPLSGFVRADDSAPFIPYEMSAGGAGVIHLVLLLGGAFFLFQMANILRRMGKFYGNEAPPYRARILSVLGRLLRVVSVVSVVALLIGYVNLANALFWPSVKSLALVGLLILLQDFIADLYSLALRSKEGARDALTPLLVGILLIIGSIPLFALIWGASLNDLSESWAKIMAGVSFGGIALSPRGVLTFIIVFALGYMLTRWLQGAVRSQILPRTKLDAGAQNAAVSGMGYVGIFLAALFAINSAGLDLSNLALVASALSVGIGFGLQTIVQNFVSGIILLIERPISVGDWVEAGGQQGIVQNISVRSTRIKTFDQTDVIVPNSDLITQSVTNWTRGSSRGRIIVKVGVAYGSDTRKVERILHEIAEDQATVLIDPAPAVLLTNFGADSLDFEIRCILSDISGGVGVASEMRHQIARRFSDEGIEIPFAQRDLWLRNPETLFAKPGKKADTVKEADAPPREEPSTHEIADIRSTGEFPSDGDGGDGDGDGDST